MMRLWIPKARPLGCCIAWRAISSTQCFFQRGQWDNDRSGGNGNRGGSRAQRGYDNQGNQGNRGNRGDWEGNQRGGRDDGYGNQGNRGNRGDWEGNQRGGRDDGYGNQGNRGNRGDWEGNQRGGRDDGYGNQGNRGNRGDWEGNQRGGRDDGYGNQGNRGNRGNRGDLEGNQRGGRDDRYGYQGNRGDGGNSRGDGRRSDRGGDYGRGRSRQDGQEDRGGRPRRDGKEDSAPPLELFDEAAAKSMFDMKRQYKGAKSEKDRRAIGRDARRIIRRARIDPSTQDEKTVTMFLNAAATFRSYPHSESIKQAVQWMRQNIEALSPQNIALFANAIGSLHVIDADVILRQVLTPAVKSLYTQMSPVELVMILQAFQRAKVTDNEALQELIFKQLSSFIPQMPAQQLSTLASVLVDCPLRKTNESAWQEMANTVLSKTVTNVEKIHSREVITLLRAAPHLCVPEEHSIRLVVRAIDTVGFHTDDHIAELLSAVAAYRSQKPSPGAELLSKLDELVAVLMTRLEKVAPFVDPSSAASLMWHGSHAGVTIPAAALEAMLDALMREMRYHRLTFRQCAKLAEGVAAQRAAAGPLLLALGDYCIGRRPPRDGAAQDAEAPEDDGAREARAGLYARFLGDATRARLALEDAHAANAGNGAPGESVAKTLAQHLEEAVPGAIPREVLRAAQAICTAAGECPARNRASDQRMMEMLERRVINDREGFMQDLHQAHVERFVKMVGDSPRAAKMVRALSAN